MCGPPRRVSSLRFGVLSWPPPAPLVAPPGLSPSSGAWGSTASSSWASLRVDLGLAGAVSSSPCQLHGGCQHQVVGEELQLIWDPR